MLPPGNERADRSSGRLALSRYKEAPGGKFLSNPGCPDFRGKQSRDTAGAQATFYPKDALLVPKLIYQSPFNDGGTTKFGPCGPIRRWPSTKNSLRFAYPPVSM